MVPKIRLGALAPYFQTPTRIAADARYDLVRNVAEGGLTAEIPTEALVKTACYGIGILALARLTERAIVAVASRPRPAPAPVQRQTVYVKLPSGAMQPAVVGGDLDMLDAEMVPLGQLHAPPRA